MRSDPDRVGGGLYGAARGRAVWEPERFSAERDPRFPDGLSCYHRNLVALALQVEAHIALVRWGQPKLGTTDLAFDTENLLRWSTMCLADLYAGAPRTYRSASARLHIEQDRDFVAVREAWAHFGVGTDTLTGGAPSLETA